MKGIREACERITDRPVFAGIIGPYSLAGRLLDMTEIMILCYEEPEMVETVLEKATEFLIAYAKAFKDAGANGVVMAEPAAGLLSPGLMEEFSNPYVKKVREAVEDDSFVVMYHNCGNIEPLLGQIGMWMQRLIASEMPLIWKKHCRSFPRIAFVIGNIDPAGVLRNGTPELVREETKKLLERCRKYPNFVIASGCDIPPMTPFENMDAFFETIEEFYK